MGILSRTILREIFSGAVLGTAVFTFVLFLRSLGRLFEQLVNSTTNLRQISALFVLILPSIVTFTIPVGVLVGILIALGRMSSDGEIIALRAAGVPGRMVLKAVLAFSLAGVAVTAYASCVLQPWATRETYRVLNKLVTARLSAEIRERIFEEQFPDRVIYVDNVMPGPIVQWRRVFIADTRPPASRDGAGERGEGPRITIARQAIAVPDTRNNRIQLSLADGSTFEVGKESTDYLATGFPKGDQALDAPQRAEIKARDYTEMDLGPLFAQMATSVEAAIEFHRRLALPVACLVLGMMAVPLGVSSRKGGKSAAFALTVALAFVYYMGLISLIALAKQKALPAGLAVWLPNAIFGVAGLVMLARLEIPGDRDWSANFQHWIGSAWGRIRSSLRRGERTSGPSMRLALLPQIVDAYILSSFLYYLVILLFSFVVMTHVFTFFELLGDIVRNKIPMPRVGAYHLFLTPMLTYDFAPVGVLVAVLFTYGVLARTNEITAMKACGVSLYRLSVPVLLAGAVLSGGLFAFDYYIVPEANLIQDALRNEIKGRPIQTFYRPDRKWIFGRGPWIYHYKHFDQANHLMAGVNVYHLDKTTFRLKRHIYAETARWEPTINHWVFQNGWAREFAGSRRTGYQDFQGLTATFAELDEPPSYFLIEVIQDKQMNFHQLAAYISDLQQSGVVDTTRLQVQYHKKFSRPLFALIMALISCPFAFFSGNRGAMTPVGFGLGIGLCYLAVNQLFEQMGNASQLPPQLAAWGPNVVFTLAGLYFFTRVRT